MTPTLHAAHAALTRLSGLAGTAFCPAFMGHPVMHGHHPHGAALPSGMVPPHSPWGYAGLPSEHADVSPEKAKEILRDGTVHGHPLTDAQRGMFGAIAGRADHSGDLRNRYAADPRAVPPARYAPAPRYDGDADGRYRGPHYGSDSGGREHRGSGPGGGQFTSKGRGGDDRRLSVGDVGRAAHEGLRGVAANPAATWTWLQQLGQAAGNVLGAFMGG